MFDDRPQRDGPAHRVADQRLCARFAGDREHVFGVGVERLRSGIEVGVVALAVAGQVDRDGRSDPVGCVLFDPQPVVAAGSVDVEYGRVALASPSVCHLSARVRDCLHGRPSRPTGLNAAAEVRAEPQTEFDSTLYYSMPLPAISLYTIATNMWLG